MDSLKMQKEISKAFSKKLYESGGRDMVDQINRDSFNMLVGTSPSNYRLKFRNELGINYTTGKQALREQDPELARAKSYQEMMFLTGNDLLKSTQLAKDRFNITNLKQIKRV
tara:strand:+ start:8252 stop:8587 length:336 start_codon:yes stop_codon:yes gene_type:complete